MEKGTFFVVATPIGNLSDLSPRVESTLKSVACVYAEDTRRSRILLQHISAEGKPCKSLHEHNEEERIGEVIARLEKGENLALVSDAGTPAVSDPGSRIVNAIWKAGLSVCPIAGPSALTTALSAAGFPLNTEKGVLFLGFLASNEKKKFKSQLETIHKHTGTVVLFESPNRVMQTLKALAELDETREVLVSRELTKKYESLERKELRSWMETLENISKKGEFTLVIGPREEQKEEACFEQIDSALRECLQEGLSARDASRAVSICLKVSKQKVYQRCQVLSGE